MEKRNNIPVGRLCPRQLFQVSDDVRHLDVRQLQAFEAAFAAWASAAKRADSVRARERLRLTFLLLRYTGARLGEILALNDRTDFDFQRGVVRLGQAPATREVPLSEGLCALLKETVESPMGCSLSGVFFHLDPGYLRRICYARGKECGLTKDLANPRVLRNTRAVEMLRGGVPLTVVTEVLGQSLEVAAHLQQFSHIDATSIVRLAQQDMRKQTSARNTVAGTVTTIKEDGIMAEVTLRSHSGFDVVAVITADSLNSLGLAEGSPVIATIKSTLVNVLQDAAGPKGSPRNRLRATILRVLDSPTVTEITGRLDDGTEVCALISSRSARTLNLRPGDSAGFWFKALSVVLGVRP